MRKRRLEAVATTTTIATTTQICRLLARSALACLLLASSACGLIDEERNKENKRIYIDIPDEAFRKVCLDACDLDVDGQVSRYEAQRVLTLTCPDANIRSVDGINEFIQLRNLSCPGNKIQTMDLTRNVQLEKIDCAQNELSYLNVTGLYALRELLCNTNQLPSLQLGNTQALTTLNCDRNQFTILDVSHCSQTMRLLSTLDNPRLTVIYTSYTQRFDVMSINGNVQVQKR